jgi:hypothetical protein
MASEEKRNSRQAPGVVVPTTRVNLALPFSKITVEEPGRELAELAAIVAALAAAVEQAVAQAAEQAGAQDAPEPDLPELRKRADALVTRLRR